MNVTSKRSEVLALVGAGISTILLICTLLVAGGWSHSRLIQVAWMPLTGSILFAILAWWRGRLLRLKILEENEHERLRKEYDRTDLFGDRDDQLKVATNAFNAFNRLFVPGFTLVWGVALTILGGFVWHHFNTNALVGVERDAFGVAGVCLFMMIFCLLAGSFFNGISREDGCRWLGPVAASLLFTAFVYFIGGLIMIAERFDKGTWDEPAARFVLFLVIVFGVELVLSFIIEFYRPRTADEVERPLFESRILALVTQPGGIAHNVAHALDYQFGFKVSDTWFYRFLERSVIPFVGVLAVALYLLDCVVVVDTHEMAVKERFGSPLSTNETALGPGLYFKLPAPYHTVRKFPVQRIDIFTVGYHEGESQENAPPAPPDDPTQGDPTGRVIVWDKKHAHSDIEFLVASREQEEQSSVPVNILSVDLPLYYKIDENRVCDYAYNYANPIELVGNIASAETVAYLASVDFVDIIGRKRLEMKAEIERRIRKSVAELDPPIGVEIVFIGVMGVNPSTETAPSFQNIMSAQEERETKILQAVQYEAEQQNAAAGQSNAILSAANAYKYEKETISKSVAERFRQQLTGFKLAPEVFKLRAQMELLESHTMNMRKYIISSESGHNVINVNLEKKIRPDLLDLDVESEEY